MRSGSYTTGREEIEKERAAERSEYERLDREFKAIRREVIERREEASRSHAKRSKKGIPIRDHDARFKKNHARVTGKDGKAGQLTNQLSGRLSQIEAQRNRTEFRKQQELGVWLDANPAPKPVLFYIEPGVIPLGDGRSLRYPALVVERTGRIAITGPNGAGKSTLIRFLEPRHGLPDTRVVTLPQEITAAESTRVLESVHRIPPKQRGHLLRIVSRLGSDPKRLLQSETPSPGEVRKLLLAQGITREPWLIILDEPTNHLDLPSIECLENALQDCPCALILVSHDTRFLDALRTRRWHITSRKKPVLEIR